MNKIERYESIVTDIILHYYTNTITLKQYNIIRLFRIMSIPTTFRLFLVLTSEQIGRRLPVFTLLL